jgi:beta-carotene 15,15'-monooxygenase
MFYTDPMVVFHHVNAYEKDGCILFDVIAYEDSSLYQLFYLANLNQDFEENSRLTSVPTLRRFAIPLHVDKVRLHRVGSFFLDRLEPRWDGTWHLFD